MPSDIDIFTGFYINLPIGGLVFAVLMFTHLPEPLAKPPWQSVLRALPAKLDLVGFGIFAPAALQLLLALQYGGIVFPWDSPRVVGLFCGAGAAFLLWVAWDWRRGDTAMIPLSMAKRRVVWSGCLTYGFFLSQMFTVSYYLPIYFQAIKGASPTLSGVYILPLVLPHVLFSFLSGVLGQYHLPGKDLVQRELVLLTVFSWQDRLFLTIWCCWGRVGRHLQWTLLHDGCPDIHGTVDRLPDHRRRCPRNRIAGGR